jgi:uncharacterized repeat protein (TIGR03843 family)
MDVKHEDAVGLAVYKPRRGERPLWDFPDGTLCQREVAAFLVSEALGWHIVPPTILRDGPQGIGMVQIFIEHDPEQHYFSFEKKQLPQLQLISLFDHVINNADRKGGHCLLDANGRMWAIDHGVCFHMQPKLRTVIWDFAATTIPDALLSDLDKLHKAIMSRELVPTMGEFLTEREISALCERADRLISARKFPEPGPGRQYPWPPI